MTDEAVVLDAEETSRGTRVKVLIIRINTFCHCVAPSSLNAGALKEDGKINVRKR